MSPDVKATFVKGKEQIAQRLLTLKDRNSIRVARGFHKELRDIRFNRLDRLMIEAAYGVGKGFHRGQKRLSGESYFEAHCVPVTTRLLKWGVTDALTIIASLLHDSIEDSKDFKVKGSIPVSREKAHTIFTEKFNGYLLKRLRIFTLKGLEANMHGVTRIVSDLSEPEIDGIKIMTKEQQTAAYNENLKAADHNDGAVWRIKLSDRLHYFETTDRVSQQKIEQKVLDTLPLVQLFVVGVLNYPKAWPDVWKLADYLVENAPQDKKVEVEEYIFNTLALDKLIPRNIQNDTTN